MFVNIFSTITAIALTSAPGGQMELTPAISQGVIEYPMMAQKESKYSTWSLWPEKKEEEPSAEQPTAEESVERKPTVGQTTSGQTTSGQPGANRRPGQRSTAPAANTGRQPSPSQAPSIYNRPDPEVTKPVEQNNPPKSFYPWRDRETNDQRGAQPPYPYETRPQEEETGPYGDFKYLEARLGFWGTTFSAEVQSSTGTIVGSNIDLSDELGLGTSKTVILAGASARLSDSVRIWVDTFNVDYQASTKLKTELVFKGVLFDVNSTVNTSISVNSWRAGLDVSLVRGDLGYFNVGVAGDFLKTSTSLTAFNLITTTANINVGLPMLTGSVRVYPVRMLGLGLDVAWIGYDKSKLYDIAFYADISPLENVGISLGWRGITLDVNTDGEKVYVGWTGLFGQVVARF
ncbi:MAG: hypothetical protein OEZ04_10610 [Nitrospinota bacterium]|nr:hypothetical protein [Nitrospinota bacterium]